MSHAFDEQGFFAGALEPWSADEVFTVLAPEREGAFAPERWDHQARRFFGCSVKMTPVKRYDGGWPLADAATLTIARLSAEGGAHPVLVRTVPIERAPALLTAGRRGAEAMGGAGFDVLVERTRRVWQFRPTGSDDATWALLGAAVIASVLLGPILAPDGRLLGVKSARERLGNAGFR